MQKHNEWGCFQANWGDWYLPDGVCDFFLAMDVTCSTSSILNLVAISFDRYFAVTSPILYSQHRHNPTPAYTVIFLCWSTSLAIGLPIMFGLNHRPDDQVCYLDYKCYSKTIFSYIFRKFSPLTYHHQTLHYQQTRHQNL